MPLTRGKEKMFNPEAIIKSIKQTSNKDSNAYKVTEYYLDLTGGSLDDGGIAIARGKVLNIEKYLINWAKKHPYDSTLRQPEENAIILINDLRNRGFLE